MTDPAVVAYLGTDRRAAGVHQPRQPSLAELVEDVRKLMMLSKGAVTPPALSACTVPPDVPGIRRGLRF